MSTIKEILFSSLLNEEYKLKTLQTGLPLLVWVDHGGVHNLGGHANRIKVQNGRNGNTDLENYGIPFTISDNPTIPKDNKIKSVIKSKDVKLIKQFIILNQKILTDLDMHKITPAEFNERITKVNQQN